MQTKTYKSADHEVKLSVPETVEEFDMLAGKDGACLAAAIDHEVFHGTLGEFREAFAEGIEKETGIARIVTKKTVTIDGKEEEEEDVERFSPYYNRVCAQLNKDPKSKPFQNIADDLSVGGANEIHFDPKAKERKPGAGAKISKKFLAAADDLVAKGKVTKFQTKAEGFGVTFTLTGDAAKDRNIIALAVKAVTEAMAAQLAD